MLKIPKLSQPLTKLIRTGEGVLLYAFNAALIVLPALNDLPWAKAIPWLAITDLVAFASRTLLKAVAVTQPLTGGPPTPFDPGKTVDEIQGEIEQGLAAMGQVQAKQGTPAATIVSGLAPTPTPPAP